MPPYEKSLLEETAKLTKENNKILRKMQRAARWARFFGLLKWVVIIGLTIGAYYYLEPYLQTILSMYSQIGGDTEKLQGLDIGKLQELLKSF